jgi:hypoxanthine phosphoribosyltransferase
MVRGTVVVPDADLGRVLASDSVLRGRVQELGHQITGDYAGKEPLVVGVLKGAATFTTDLVRHIALPVTMDWVWISTYGRGSTAGQRRVRADITEAVAGRDVIVVEDILDTGGTLSWLVDRIGTHSPSSVECCVLLRKPNTAGHLVYPRYVGFDVDVHWVAGYGIDYAEQWRNRTEISEVRIASPVT